MDIAKVPIKFLLVDRKAVMGTIHDGTKEIPGLRIYQKEQLAIK